MRYYRKCKERGFTLIELLAVIFIIGLLSSFLFYKFNISQTRARDARRMADVKQIEAAMSIYFHDHNNFPGNTDNDSSGWDCGGSSYDNDFISQLATENYIKPVPVELKKNMGCSYRYFNYGARVILGVRLEFPQIAPDKCDNYQSWVADPYWYCVDFKKN